jgi:rhamnosyltransferase subunit B
MPQSHGTGLETESMVKPLVVLLTFGTGGDVQPFLMLAAGLQGRGYRTLLIGPRFHEKLVQGTGQAHALFGTHEQAQAVLDDPDLWHERKGFGVVWRGLLPSLDEIQDLLLLQAQACDPCVVLCHPFLVPVAAMAREQQPSLRIVCAYLAPSTLRTIHDPLTVGSLDVPGWVPGPLRRALWRAIDRFWVDPDLLPGLNAARRARGLKPVQAFLVHMEAAADASVGLFPNWFAPRQPDWPATFVTGDFPLGALAPLQRLDGELQDFLAAGDAPIAFTPGTGHRHAKGYFKYALDALRALGKRGLFLTAFADQLPAPLPPDVRWQPYAPFDCLLPQVALLVHHGGIGTTAEALRAGVPQLVVPFAFDQFDNGRRIQRIGAGRVLPAVRANAHRLEHEMARLLSQRKSQPTAAVPEDLNDGQGLRILLDATERALAATNSRVPGPCECDAERLG